MFLYVVAGRTRQGKSLYVKRMLVQPKSIHTPCFAFDHQNEYGASYITNINNTRVRVPGVGLDDYNSKTNPSRSRFIPGVHGEMDDFINIALTKEGCNIVFEEATIPFKGGVSKDMRNIVVSRFHKANNIILVFHELAKVPTDIINMANYLILFKTNDNPKKIAARFENPLIDAAFEKQRRKPDGAPATIVDIYNYKIDGKPFNL